MNAAHRTSVVPLATLLLAVWGNPPRAQVLRQLTDTALPWVHMEPDITRDGRQALYARGVVRITEWRDFDLYRAATGGGEPLRLTWDIWAYTPSLSGDGTRVVFEAYGLGNGVWMTDDQGSPPQLLVGRFSAYPVIGKASEHVVFQSGEAGLLGSDLYQITLEGGAASRITHDGDGLRKNPRVDYAGDWIVYHSQANPLGTNPDGSTEVFRIRSNGTGWQQLTDWGALLPDISADGSLIVYESWGDPLGHNPDGNAEIFLYRAFPGTTEQLTATVEGDSIEPRISGNGRYVYFSSSSPFFEPVADGSWQLYRADLWTWRLERVSGRPHAGSYLPSGPLRYNPAVAVDESGERVVFVGNFDGTDRNDDRNVEVFFADFTALPEFEVSASEPTVLRWEPDPRAAAYDVIRGDLANLRITEGLVTDLGSVVCLAEGLTDPTTAAAVDTVVPDPGQGFYFLYRWTQGTLDGPGSWGRPTWGFERFPSDGGCAP